jgi:hypothetical protein
MILTIAQEICRLAKPRPDRVTDACSTRRPDHRLHKVPVKFVFVEVFLQLNGWSNDKRLLSRCPDEHVAAA